MNANGVTTIGNATALVSPPGRGWTPEDIAERFMARLIVVAETAPPPIRDQAEAFRAQAHALALFYLREAVRSDRTTVANRLREAGFRDSAALVQEI